MAEAAVIAGLGWVASPSFISKLVNKSTSYLDSNIAKGLEEELETTLLPKIQLTIEAAQHCRPDHIAPFAKWLARLKNAYFDAEAILHDLEYERLKRKAKGDDKNLLVRLSFIPIIKPLVKKASMLSPQKRELLQRLNKLIQVAAEAKTFRDLVGIQETGSKDPDVTTSFLTDKVAAEAQTFRDLSGIQKTESKDDIITDNSCSVTSLLENDLVKNSISNLGSDIVKDLEDLETTLLPQFHLTIQAAQQRPPRDVAPLTCWLARLKSACDDAEAILHEIKHKDRGEATKSSTSALVKKASQKENLVQRLNELKEVAVEAKTVRDSLGITGNNPPVTSPLYTDKIFGRDENRDDIINFLLDDKDSSGLRKSYSVVAITGTGGVGKTTLAQYVYNDPYVKGYFNLRMWLCLSRNFDINKVTKEMIECASENECPNLHSLGFLQHMLTETLSKSSNIMVVLDDVRYDNYDRDAREQQWGSLLVPFASRERGTCKIVVTSRSTSFPMALLPEKLIKLSNLALGDFKSLLRYCTIESLQISNPLLKNDSSDMIVRNKIVDQIAEKMSNMGKQPLAAKVVGNELCARPDIMFWEDTEKKFSLSTDGVVVGNNRFVTSSLVTDKVFGRDGDRDKIINSVTHLLLTNKVFGRDRDRDEIINFLLDEQGGSSLRESYSVVAITGMGGVGKTTLALYVYNDERVKKHFGVRMWLSLSRNFDINEVTKKMIECVSREKCPNLHNLRDNIMVVLDDVWYDREGGKDQLWENLLKPFLSWGGTCKIVVTSRSSWFPNALQPEKLIQVSDLAPDDFISLLRYHAIDHLHINNPQLKNDLSDILYQIAKKMSQLPLAAKVVGNMLRERPEISFWRATLENVNLSDIREILLSSFHRFDVQLQRCFLFCGVFPKGTRFTKGGDDLVPFWVALDFIQPSDDNINVEDIGFEYFRKMVENSIFHLVDKNYIMHDLFHDLAEYLSAEDCIRVTDIEREIPSTVQHVYLKVNNENLKNLSSICKLSNLRTLILGNPIIDDISEIIPIISTKFRNLRVLHVESRDYKILSRVVGDFRNLRLLSIWESSIEELSDSVLQLYHLQFLWLPSSVKTLPTKLSNLINLRHIGMYNSDGHQLNTLPPIPYLGKLTSLQGLDEFHVRNEEGYQLQQLRRLNEIGGSLRIVNLENVRDMYKAVEARLIDKPKLKKLELVWAEMAETNGLEIEVIEALRPPAKLEELTIDGYRGSTYPTWLQEDSFRENIKVVRFFNCNGLTTLPLSIHQFHLCSELVLENLGALRELSTFPKNLARLSIIECPCLIFVCENEQKVNEDQSKMESQFLEFGVEGYKGILDHELKSFEHTGSKENCAEQLQIVESATWGNAPELSVNVNRAWWCCHQQRMNFIFRFSTRANRLKLPSMLRIFYLGYCCVSDGALSDCLRGMATLEELYLWGIMTITTLPPAQVLESLRSLQVVEIKHCWYLRSLGGLDALPHLERFLVQGCWCLGMDSGYTPLPSTLQSFIIIACNVPQAILNGFLPCLQNVIIIDCHVSMLSFRQLTLLKSLVLDNCPGLLSIWGLESRPFINTLQLLLLPNLVVETVLEAWQGCRELFISSSAMLNKLLSSQDFIPPLQLCIKYCQEEAISFEKSDHLQSIKRLLFLECKTLGLPETLSDFSTLEFIEFEDCPELSRLPELPCSVQHIRLRGCPVLRERCQPNGPDWYKIRCIQHIEIE